jgi:glycosyltransferase involved in cell wall biosynthesis
LKPRVLHITQATGGLETILLLLFRHYDRDRFEFHLACPPGTALEVSARQLGVPVFPVPMVRRAAPVGDPIALARLVRLIRRERYAIVHGHSAKGGYLGRLAARLSGGAKTVYAPQAFSYLSQQGPARSFFFMLERLAVPLTDLVVAASESERVRAVQEVGFPAQRVVVIPNSIDFSEAAQLTAHANGGEPLVLTVGRFSYQKNPEMFVRVAGLVAKRRPDARFCMLGAGFAGPLEQRVRRLVAEAGLSERLDILRWVPKRESLELMAGAAVFVLTSRFEGMPNTLLEALMLARPVVVTDVDGSRDVIALGGGGGTVPLDDDSAMADRIVSLLDDVDAARHLGERGRARAAEIFDVHRNVPALISTYERLLAA